VLWTLEEQWIPLTLGSAVLLLLVYIIARHCILRYNNTLDKFMDYSNSIMVLTDKEEILKVNRAGLNFFGFRTLEEMLQNHKHIIKFFEEVTEKVTDKKVIHGKRWVVDVAKKGHQDIKVKMKPFGYCNDSSSSLEQYFNLRVNSVASGRYLLTFDNVTGLVREKDSIKEKAEHDPLTGVFNRLKFDDLFDEMFGRAMHFNETFSIVLFDIDHFKQINDSYGHTVGDSVLRELARLVRLQLRKNDLLARWGGEEFIILSRLTTDIQAKQLADRLRKVIESYRFDHLQTKVTCSFGVTQYYAEDKESDIFERADKALYDAKKRGRNRVVVRSRSGR